MKTVAVIEGFAGGPMHTRQFREALSKAGFSVIRDRQKADVIIAHSAGIYGIPVTAHAQLLMLIGPTYWPGKALIKRVAQHARSTKRYHVEKFGWRYYMWKELLEIYYIFRRNTYMWLGIMNNNRLGHISKLMARPGTKTIIMRNLDDPFSSPELKTKIKGPNVKFIELPGVHDDFVKNPEPYIDLLLKELK